MTDRPSDNPDAFEEDKTETGNLVGEENLVGVEGKADDGDDASDDDASDDDDEEKESSAVRSLVEWAAVLAGAVVIAIIIRSFLFTTFWIPSASMEPTLLGPPRKDRVVVNRLSYKFGEPSRGDIIVFEAPDEIPTILIGGKPVKDLIKRIVGLPGDKIELRDGQVYINGTRYAEPYLPEGTLTLPCNGGPSTFVIPKDAVFVMGDNRYRSEDARCWPNHWLPESQIVGRAFVRIWPLSVAGGL